MIHNNLRKMLKRLFGQGFSSSTTDGLTNNEDFTDITGYTGSISNGDNLGCYVVSSSIYFPFDSNPPIQVNNVAQGSLLGSTTSSRIFGVIGSTEAGEGDYTLGNISNYTDIVITTANSKRTDIIFSTTFYNPRSTAVTFDEVGVIYHIRPNSSTVKWHNNTEVTTVDMLLIKEVFSTPQTIPAGGAVSVAFNLLGDVISE